MLRMPVVTRIIRNRNQTKGAPTVATGLYGRLGDQSAEGGDHPKVKAVLGEGEAVKGVADEVRPLAVVGDWIAAGGGHHLEPAQRRLGAGILRSQNFVSRISITVFSVD